MDTKLDYTPYLEKIKFLKENHIVIIWFLLVGSALFNFGYFWLCGIKYIGLLSVSDYYATSFSYFCSVLLMFGGIVFFSNRPKDNIIFIGFKNLGLSIKLVRTELLEQIKIKGRLIDINHMTKKINTSKDTKHGSPDCEKIEKCKQEISRIKKVLNLRLKKCFGIMLYWLRVVLGTLFILGSIFLLLYRFSGVAGCVLLGLFMIFSMLLDSLLKDLKLNFVASILSTCIFIFCTGAVMLFHDVRDNKMQVCNEQNCYDVIRKITDGYFVIDDEKFFFLDNDLNIKNQQKRPTIIDLVKLLD